MATPKDFDPTTGHRIVRVATEKSSGKKRLVHTIDFQDGQIYVYKTVLSTNYGKGKYRNYAGIRYDAIVPVPLDDYSVQKNVQLTDELLHSLWQQGHREEEERSRQKINVQYTAKKIRPRHGGKLTVDDILQRAEDAAANGYPDEAERLLQLALELEES